MRKKKVSPAEKRAEGARKLVLELGPALTMAEMEVIADAVSRQAEKAIKEDRRFLEKVKIGSGCENKG